MTIHPDLKICGRCKSGFDKWLSDIVRGSDTIKQDMKQFIEKIIWGKEVAEGEDRKVILESVQGVLELYNKFDKALGEFDDELAPDARYCTENMAEPCETMSFLEYLNLQQSSALAQAAFEKDVRVFEWTLAHPETGESKTPPAIGQVFTTLPCQSGLKKLMYSAWKRHRRYTLAMPVMYSPRATLFMTITHVGVSIHRSPLKQPRRREVTLGIC